MTSYFDILGVDESASDEEIEAAFRKQTKKYHPDKSEHSSADELFLDIKKAKNELIGDGERPSNPPSDNELNHEWKNGEPLNSPTSTIPTGETPSEEGDTGPGTTGQTGDEEDDSGSENGPWGTSTPADVGPDPGDKANVNIEDGGEESEPHTGPSEELNTEKSGLSRRSIITMLGVGGGGLFLANQLDWKDTNLTGSNVSEQVEVEPSESIQDAIDRVAPGGTVTVNSGTYSQSVTVNKSIEIIAPQGATLDGHNTDGGIAFALTGSEIVIDGFKITRYNKVGIHTDGSNQQITLKNNQLSNIDNQGIEITGKKIELDSITVQDTGDTGIKVNTATSGELTMSNIAVERSQRKIDENPVTDDEIISQGHGIRISGGSQVSLTGVDSLNNGGHNIRIDGGDVLGQTIQVTELSSVSAGLNGVVISGTEGEDKFICENIESSKSGGYGFHIGTNSAIESAEIIDGEMSGNGNSGLRINGSSDGEVICERLQIDRSERTIDDGNVLTSYDDEVVDAGHGIEILGGSRVSLSSVDSLDNGGHNISIHGGDVLGQTINIRDSKVTSSNSKSGIFTGTTDGEDENHITGTAANSNSKYGLNLGGDSVIIKDVEASENGSGSYKLRETDDEDAQITNSFQNS